MNVNGTNNHPNTSGLSKWHDADDLRWAVRHWATRIGVSVRQIHFRPMRTKWTSISTADRLTLTPELLDLPKPLGKFVIGHELVHLLTPTTARCSRVLCPHICRIERSGRR